MANIVVYVVYLYLHFYHARSRFLPIKNSGFETDTMPNGDPIPDRTYRYGDPIITDWARYDPNTLFKSWGTGIDNTVGCDSYNDPPIEGTQSAYILRESRIGKGEIGIVQQLTETVTANTIYTLTVHIGNPGPGTWSSQSNEGTDSNNGDSFYGFPGYRIDLLAENDNILVSDSTSASPADYEWAEASATITILPDNAYIGETLSIRLINLNEAKGDEIGFDYVRLEANTVVSNPTPAPLNIDSKQPTSSPSKIPLKYPTQKPSVRKEIPAPNPSQIASEHEVTVTAEYSDAVSTEYLIVKDDKVLYAYALGAFICCLFCCIVLYICTKKEIGVMADRNDRTDIEEERKEVKQWMDSIGLGQYYALFIEFGFETMKIIAAIDDDNVLKEIGVNKIGHRVLFLHEIKKIEKDSLREQRAPRTQNVASDVSKEHDTGEQHGEGQIVIQHKQKMSIALSDDSCSNESLFDVVEDKDNETAA